MAKRKHIPALNPDRLTLAIQHILADERLPEAAKRQMIAMLQAAANPHSESVQTVLKTLPKERRNQIQGMAEEMTRHTSGIVQRAGKALDAISDEEWNRLVDEANKEQKG
jgi:gas vesicle protein